MERNPQNKKDKEEKKENNMDSEGGNLIVDCMMSILTYPGRLIPFAGA